ncbi:demethoxyubiquinone hydroxylase family protein [Pelagerythrobacter aerophilus]|uniref:demethoxyubiquinone hydroxylase family protein n=1 Tax=Pelagerythrobacter aerophilus TaxID=2306995 RepID=UPI001E41A17E|nr:demethoxyubiquinone hydroxylase family protein [Pelagerythrobacter aerophilus]
MTLSARLRPGETIGDRVVKVDHAGEHGAVSIYTAQRWLARWRAPDLVEELDLFLAHERRHRSIFEAELKSRGKLRCRSFHLCGLGGLVLGILTGLIGRQAIAATTVAVERVVLRHIQEQVSELAAIDVPAVRAIREIIADEEQHHDLAHNRVHQRSLAARLIDPVVTVSTEAVIRLGMKL